MKRSILFLIFGLLFCASAHAIAVDSQMPSSAGVYQNACPNPWTFSFTNSAGNVLYLAFQYDAISGSFSATYNSASMTQVGSHPLSSGTGIIMLFRLSSPATGSNSFSIANPGGFSCTAAAISFSGANSTPDSGSASTADWGGTTSTAETVTVPSTTSGNYVIQAACVGDGWTYTYSGTESASINGNGGSYCNNLNLQYDTTSGGSKVMTITSSGADAWATVAIEVKASGGAAACKPALMLMHAGGPC